MEVEQTPAPELVRRPSLFPLVACYTERLTTATTTVQEMLKGVRYGFNNQYSGLFSQIQEEVRSHCNKLDAQLLSGAQRSPTGRATAALRATHVRFSSADVRDRGAALSRHHSRQRTARAADTDRGRQV